MTALAPYWKAVAGFLAPGIVLLIKDIAADSALPTAHEWLTIALACVAGAVGVYAAPKNAPTPARSRVQRGAVDLTTVLVLVVLVILVLVLVGYIH